MSGYPFGWGYAFNASIAVFSIKFAVPLRYYAATFAASPASQFSALSNVGGGITVTSINGVANGPAAFTNGENMYSYEVQIGTAGGFVVGDATRLQSNSTTPTFIEVGSEI